MATIKDTYRTLGGPSEGAWRDRGSKFLAYAFPASSESGCKARLEEVKQAHPKARHHCYAYRLGLDQNNFRANDDGEPSGTAGRPILGQIDSFELTNVLVVVVRYFGGTLLGASGLIQAYRESTAAALAAGQIIERTVEEVYRLSFDYALMGDVMSSLERLQLDTISHDFGDRGQVDIAIRKSEAVQRLRELKAGIAGIYLEEVDGLEEIAGLKVSRVGER